MVVKRRWAGQENHRARYDAARPVHNANNGLLRTAPPALLNFHDGRRIAIERRRLPGVHSSAPR
jgi:hypothetical protein